MRESAIAPADKDGEALVAFGRDFISNISLPFYFSFKSATLSIDFFLAWPSNAPTQGYSSDLPLTHYNRKSIYIPRDQPGAEFGYVDYPFAEDEQDGAESQVWSWQYAFELDMSSHGMEVVQIIISETQVLEQVKPTDTNDAGPNGRRALVSWSAFPPLQLNSNSHLLLTFTAKFLVMATDLDEKYVVPVFNRYSSSSAMFNLLNLQLLSTFALLLDACFAW